MKTLNQQLGDLISLQDDITHLNESGDDLDELYDKQQQRDQLRYEIVRNTRGLVTAAALALQELQLYVG